MNSKSDGKSAESTLNDLVLRVRSGDDDAYNIMLGKYHPLIEAMIKKYTTAQMTAQDTEDFRQEILLVFYNAILTYKIEQTDIYFGLYAKICITNGLISQLRSIRRRAEHEIIPLDDSIFDDNIQSKTENVSELYSQNESVRILYNLIEKNLSSYENTVWEMYISGKSSADIAAQLSKDEKSINNAIYRIRKKLRRIIRGHDGAAR